jgi:hypothetical protein
MIMIILMILIRVIMITIIVNIINEFFFCKMCAKYVRLYVYISYVVSRNWQPMNPNMHDKNPKNIWIKIHVYIYIYIYIYI